MDHLPQPPNCNPPEIDVPILCLYGEYRFSYDDLDYNTFPNRSGYVVDSWGDFLEDDIARQPWPKTLSMLQAWLYFGLLKGTLGDQFREEDFIRQSTASLFLDTSKLPDVLQRRKQQLEQISWKIARNEKDRVLADVNFAEARRYHFEGDMGGLQDGKRMETWPGPESYSPFIS